MCSRKYARQIQWNYDYNVILWLITMSYRSPKILHYVLVLKNQD